MKRSRFKAEVVLLLSEMGVESHCLMDSGAFSGVPQFHWVGGEFQGSQLSSVFYLFADAWVPLRPQALRQFHIEFQCSVFPQTADFLMDVFFWYRCLYFLSESLHSQIARIFGSSRSRV